MTLCDKSSMLTENSRDYGFVAVLNENHRMGVLAKERATSEQCCLPGYSLQVFLEVNCMGFWHSACIGRTFSTLQDALDSTWSVLLREIITLFPPVDSHLSCL